MKYIKILLESGIRPDYQQHFNGIFQLIDSDRDYIRIYPATYHHPFKDFQSENCRPYVLWRNHVTDIIEVVFNEIH